MGEFVISDTGSDSVNVCVSELFCSITLKFGANDVHYQVEVLSYWSTVRIILDCRVVFINLKRPLIACEGAVIIYRWEGWFKSGLEIACTNPPPPLTMVHAHLNQMPNWIL